MWIVSSIEHRESRIQYRASINEKRGKMKAVVQRVSESSVTIDNEVAGKIGAGLLVLLGVAVEDTEKEADYLAEKIINLRIFSDENGKMNLSLRDVGGEMLVVSQFTLLGDCRKGRRPSFIAAAGPEMGNALYAYFVDYMRQKGITVATGRFGAMMDVSLVNDGPVTLILESK
jgi:D-tyrosyl-tRNA(Tyr) deacylase